MAVRGRALRSRLEPQPHSHDALPHRDAVLDVRAASCDRLQERRDGADFQGDQGRPSGGRSSRPGADAHGHRRQRHGGRVDPFARARRAQAPGHGEHRRHRRAARMNVLLAFPVALPLAGAAFVAATDDWTPDAVKEIPAMVVAAATAVISTILLVRSEQTDLVHWFGGWHPRHGLALGIGFVVGPIGAGMAALVGVLVPASLVFSWRYMEEASRIYRVLMLVFLGGMSGFALSGDLFNMFVWFEVMGIAPYALCGP